HSSETSQTKLPVVTSGAAAPVPALKPPVDPASLVHRQLLGGEFWRKIPAYREIDEATFLDHKWQAKHTITRPDKLLEAVRDLATAEFIADVRDGFHRSP